MINQKKIYNPNKEIRIKTSMLRSDFCDYSDAYILVTGKIIVNKKAFTADDFEAPNNTVNNAIMKILLSIKLIIPKMQYFK